MQTINHNFKENEMACCLKPDANAGNLMYHSRRRGLLYQFRKFLYKNSMQLEKLPASSPSKPF